MPTAVSNVIGLCVKRKEKKRESEAKPSLLGINHIELDPTGSSFPDNNGLVNT